VCLGLTSSAKTRLQPRPTPSTLNPLRRPSTSLSPWATTPGPSSSSPPLPYGWPFTPSCSASSPKMKRNSSDISGRQSSTPKRSQFSQPGTLTRAAILGAPSRPLRWLSPSTSSTLRPLLQPSSSSPRRARSNLPSQEATPPSVETAGDTDTLLSDAPPPTRRAPFVHFIILARLTDVKIQPAPRAGTISQSHPVVRPRPPIAATAVMTTLPPSKSIRLDLDLLAPPTYHPRSPGSRPHGCGQRWRPSTL